MPLLPPPERYSNTAMVLHWLGALLVFFQVGFGWYLAEIPRRTPDRTLYVNFHKSVGLCIGVLILVRLVWRLTHRPPPPPPAMRPWERHATHVTHYVLYACLVVMPLAGYVASNFSRFGVRFFGIPLPPWGHDDQTIYAFFQGIHVAASYILVGAICLHVLAALKHLCIDRDHVVQRMMPVRKSARARKNQGAA